MKPPIGVRPEYVFKYQVNQERVVELMQAIIRYLDAGHQPLEAWFDELNRRLRLISTK